MREESEENVRREAEAVEQVKRSVQVAEQVKKFDRLSLKASFWGLFKI